MMPPLQRFKGEMRIDQAATSRSEATTQSMLSV